MTEQELIRLFGEAAQQGWGELRLQDRGLTQLPPQIGNLTKLRRLRLWGNQLTTLPPQIGLLTNLVQLDLGRNRLMTIPPQIGHLKQLRELDLRRNQLVDLPAQIACLNQLERLRIGHNHFQKLPDELGQLHSLQELDLASNYLEELPASLGKLNRLRLLDVSKNKLIRLPPEFCELMHLSEMGSGYRIVNGVFLLDGLNGLQENPTLVSPPPEVVHQGPRAVFAFLRELSESAQEQWRAKVIVVGEGGTGKTSLVSQLCDGRFNPRQDTTRGLEQQILKLRHPTREGVQMELNIWDFGGQELYHALHQYFLTDRSLYLLVWNTRVGYEQCKLDYWLRSIRARAPRSPVLLVATHIDQRSADYPLSEIRRRHPDVQIVGACEISNSTTMGLAELRRQLAMVAAELPGIGQPWPPRWLQAERALLRSPHIHLSINQVLSLLKINGVKEREDVLLECLHQMGTIIHFRDDPDLKDLILLKPYWVSRMLSRVLDNEEVFQAKGLLSPQRMQQVWRDIPTELHQPLRRLMERFDLACRTGWERRDSQVIDRLPMDPPAYENRWNAHLQTPGCRELSMSFHLGHIPAGVPGYVLARLHRFSTGANWRYGALLSDANDHQGNRRHLALLCASRQEGMVELTVRGPHPYAFFAQLRDAVEAMLARYPGLPVERLLRCPGHAGQLCSHAFKLNKLHERLSQSPPRTEIECQESTEMVSIPALLYGWEQRTQDAVRERQQQLWKEWQPLRQQVTQEAGQNAEEARQTRERYTQVKEELHALSQMTQRWFLRQFRHEQKEQAVHAPTVCLLGASTEGNWELQLFCEKPGSWHPVQRNGRFPVSRANEWLPLLASYLRQLWPVIQHTLPKTGSWLHGEAANCETLFDGYKRWLSETVRRLPSQPEDGRPEQGVQTTLRVLRQLLDEIDPAHQRGGLHKVLAPDQHYLWLCDHHAAEYAR